MLVVRMPVVVENREHRSHVPSLRREPCVDVFRLIVDDGPVVARSRDFRLWIIGDRGATVEIVDGVVAQRQATSMASPVRGSNSSSTDFPSLPATLVIESKCPP